jgi:dCMP deaminase
MIKLSDLKTCIEVLDAYIKRSTCARVHVAALLMRNGRVNMTGWNGVPPGFNHCDEFFKKAGIDVTTSDGKELHRLFSERFELHGEMNMLAQCAKLGVETDGCETVQQVSPCLQCAKLIIASGIKEVYFRTYYDRHTDHGVSLLMLSEVKVFKLQEEEDLRVEELHLKDVYVPFEINGHQYFPKEVI